MLHLLYILAFTVIASLAISNLVRSLITVSTESSRVYPNHRPSQAPSNPTKRSYRSTIHPELLDEQGQVINEPLLVMRSVSVEDARQKLDALYDSSPNKKNDSPE
ncbi:conserved hypothetical protein [Hyella patelloides LEGE 07179]|uniref:DUF2973 domain-containing protein n=1 Tax=Hyella patelloides LEGE 07179 TaxID=945734 RepID=A0A563VSP6_9CYAN|nr:DUF2973 domain-containing protein [Hyella patelloides]VEP14494.1 conserved hypothetical protein [Hyella patelloides LEGE 07179]